MNRMMNRKTTRRGFWTAAGALLLALPWAMVAHAGEVEKGAEPMPEVLYSPSSQGVDAEYPFWVAAERVLGPDGKPDTRLFSPSALESLNALLAERPVDGCIHVGPYYADRYIPYAPESMSLFEANLYVSKLSVRGRVTGRDFGFGSGGGPAQIFRITVLEVFKGDSRERNELYFFFPRGTFAIGNHLVCKTDNQFADTPEIGDEVVIFDPYRDEDQIGAPIVTGFAEAFFVLKKDGSLSLPASVAREQPALHFQTHEEFLGNLRRLRDALQQPQ
jgi:hypothetical protein